MADSPAVPSPNPGFPSNFVPVLFEIFDGMNLKPLRPAIEDAQMYWCDGFMPRGKSNLRTLYGVGTSIFDASPLTIAFMAFANLSSEPYCYAFLSDGSVVQINTSTMATTTVAAAGTLTSTDIGLAQHGNSEVIFVADQDDGYFVWDGTLLYTSGTLGPQITITDGGTGYNTAPTISFSGGSGSGATATATVSNGVITEITMTNPGSGYVVGDTVTVTITPTSGGVDGAATVTIMPFGIKGTTVETYQSRIWVGDGEKFHYSAPASISDFTTASGGGTSVNSDSFLRVRYNAFKQSNGFLYLVGDSSMNYISGVQTSGTPTTTTFNNQNVDPQLGSPYPNSVQVFSRNIVFANQLGVFVSYGGAVTKVSDSLDGIFNTVPNFGGFSLSGAVANIFNIAVYMVLVPIIDPVSGQQVNKLLMWDGKKWFASSQDATLSMVATQEINSVLTAWGNDGSEIFPMFQQPSASFRKIAQSKLYQNPSYYYTKTISRLSYMLNFFDQSDDPVNVTIDNEVGPGNVYALPGSQAVVWYNNLGNEVEWENNLGDPVEWFGPSLVVNTIGVGQFGRLMGLTIDTMAPDMACLSFLMVDTNFQTTG